jgi:hypothetical protein
VAAASADKSKVVLPEEAGPQISVKQPRGSPPVSASIAAIPLETISGAGRTASREAGVTAASLASPANPPGKALCGGRPVPKSSTPVGCGQTGAPSFSSKIKGRPWAAEVETTAEDINSSGNFREHRLLEAVRRFRFLFAYKNSAPAPETCQA